MSEQQKINSPAGRSAAKPESPGPAASGPPRRSRRVRRVMIFLVVFFVLLGGLVASAPYIASTSTVSDWLLSRANDRIVGRLALKGLSLSWGGPIEMRDLTVIDANQREVLKVEKLTCNRGVWAFVTGYESFGDVVVDAPRATLYINNDNDISLTRALKSKIPSPPSGDTSNIPQLLGRVAIHGASVHAVRDNGVTYDIPELGGDIDLATLGRKLIGKFNMKFSDGAQIAADAEIAELAPNGRLQIEKAVGTLNLTTTGKIDLAPLAGLFAPTSGLTGTLTVNGRAVAKPDQLDADFVASAEKLQTTGRASAHAVPLDLSIKGTAGRKGDALLAKADLTGDAGRGAVDLSWDLKSSPPAADAAKLLSACLQGTPYALPEFNLGAEGSIDLVKLQKAVPGILKVRLGQEVTGGKLEISKVVVRGGAQPSASGSIAVRDLVATGDGRTNRIEPVSVDLDASLPTGKGLQITRGDLKSSFAEVSAQGAASDLHATFRANLSKLQQELGQIFDLGGTNLAGNLSGDLRVARAGDNRVDVSLRSQGEGLKIGSGAKSLDVAKLQVAHAGAVTLKEQSATRYDISEMQINADEQVIGSVTGWYDFVQEAFSATADLKKADLAFMARQADAFGIPDLARCGGILTAKANAARASRGTAITSDGSAQTRGLGKDGKPLLEGDATIAWSGVQIASDGSSLTAKALKLASTAANLDANEFRFQSGGALAVSGDLSGSADLRRLLGAIATWNGDPKPPEIGGTLGVNAKLATSNNQVTLTGRGGVDQFEIGAGQQSIREKRLDFDVDGRIEQGDERIVLNRCTLKSAPLTAELAGTIDKYRSTAECALKGRYDASWDQLTALLHELAPATATTVIVKGKSTSQFEINGPFNQPGAKPGFRGAQAGLELSWAEAQLYGVGMGSARLLPVLRDGRLTLASTAIAASGGRVNIGGVLDFQPADPTLTLPGQLQVLESVEISPELGASLLSHINPIFMFMTRAQGRVSMSLTDLRIPVSEAIKKSGAGKGVLDLGKMQVQPSGVLKEIFELGGMPASDLYPAEIGKVDFLLKDGRIYYDNFAMVFSNGFDVLFRGSVGFDDTLDLIMSLPVTEALLSRLKLPAQADVKKQLAGIRVDIPMVGTRENPRLDFAKVNTEKLLKSMIVPKLDPKGIQDLFQGQPPGANKSDAPPPPGGGNKPADPPPGAKKEAAPSAGAKKAPFLPPPPPKKKP